MSVKDISRDKLLAVASFLDGFPPLAKGQKEEDVEQYYCLLATELSRLPPPLGAKFTYTRSQMTDFGMATLKDESPSLQMLYDLQIKGLPMNIFFSCLERIKCQGALNEFIPATQPEIVQQPQSHTLFVGDILHLNCQAICKPGSPIYSWLRRRDPNAEWEPVINSFTNSLVIEDVNRDHSGVYVCRATNPKINDPQKANSFSEEAIVKIESRNSQQKTPIRQETAPPGSCTEPPVFPPVVIIQPKPLTVEYGQPATLHCQANGTNITYDWFKNDKYIQSRSNTGSVKIKQTKLEDDGMYYCKMTNPEGGIVHSDTVRLTVVPVIIIDKQPPKSIQGYNNERIRLECSAHCSRDDIGHIKYQWFRNKTAIKSATSKVYDGILRCRSSGPTYTLHCQVSVSEQSDLLPMSSSITRVTVNCIRIRVQPRDVNGVTGGSVTLYCKAEAILPLPNNNNKIDYIWLKSDGRGGKKQPLSQALQPNLSDGMLQFDKLSMNHDGYYVCQACFDKEFLESDEVKLTVSMAGARQPAQISIVRHPVSWVVAVGGTFKMRCKAKVIPEQKLLYQWRKDNLPLPIETSSVLEWNKVSDVDYAVYQCEVKTEDGSTSCISNSAITKPADTSEPDSASSIGSEAEKKLLTLAKERYAREKVALLIGNQKYECPDLDKLKHTEEEVKKVAEKLCELNFKVFTFVNLRLTEIKEVMTWFCKLLSAGVYGLFYYTGHGFSVGKMSYLMPVDSRSGDCDANECIGSDWITRAMQETLCRAVIILDCCRVIYNNSSGDSLQATTPAIAAFNAANLMEIHSTSHGSVAYEGSAFSPSFIAALDINDNINTLNSQILDFMRRKGDKATPWHNGSMNDQISLKDCIMRDDIDKERDAEMICDITETIQCLPAPVTLEGSVLGGLASLLSLKLICSVPFTNVLTVQVEVNIKRPNITPSLRLDDESLKRQELEALLFYDRDDYLSYKVTLLNMQRLKEPLVLSMIVTVCVPESDDITEKIIHTFSQKPLKSLLDSTT